MCLVEQTNLPIINKQSQKTESHLLSYPPQLFIAVTPVWVQVHPESSSQNKDFLFKTENI